ncbi:UNVERIFIED_CONTAM: hypothetical protein ITH36_25130, partial [Salmonella enterica subsp. enterica serovar Weltevreden]
DICEIRQRAGETWFEYWERFDHMCANCPQHRISDQLVIQYFYEGLDQNNRRLIDTASGGVFMNNILVAAQKLIQDMAANSQQFLSRDGSVAVVNGV